MNGDFKPSEKLPDSAYARELQGVPDTQRFSPEIESQYRAFYLAERRSHVRSFNLSLAICAFGTWIICFLSPEWRTDDFELLRLGGITLAYLSLAYLAYSARYEEDYLKMADPGCLLIALLIAVEVAHRMIAGQGELFVVLASFSFALYFFSGLLYRSALRINGVLLVCFAGSLALLGQPGPRVLYLTGILAAISAIVGLAFRHDGIRFRRLFLERGLIAEMAARDGLTGLKNRRTFDEHLARTWMQALRDRHLLVLLLIDIDHFKSLNDHYGHQAGDAALQRIAGIVNGACARPFDMAARYGGEEFALICYDMKAEHAFKLAEQLRLEVQNLGVEHRESMPLGVATISIGVAVASPTQKRSPEGLIQLADEALYKAKHTGRNCVVLYDDSHHDALTTGKFQWERTTAGTREGKGFQR